MRAHRGLQILRTMSKMIPQVDIDPSGTFKYILIKVETTGTPENTLNCNVVRGYEECGYHSDINDKFTEQLQKMKESGELKTWKAKVLGGGRIQHNPDEKTLNCYGYSQGYGKANHQLTVDILQKEYKDYKITWSDDGY